MKFQRQIDFPEQGFRLPDPPDIQKFARIFFSRWHWIIVALAISGIAGFLFLKLARPTYLATTTIQFPSRQSEIEELSKLSPNFPSNNSDYLAERYSLKSESVIRATLTELNIPFSFYYLKDFRKIDMYPKCPIRAKVCYYDRANFERGTFFLKSTRLLTYKTSNSELSIPIVSGTVVAVKGLSFKIESIEKWQESNCIFNYNDPSEQVRNLIKKIKVEEIEDGIPLLQISFRHHNAQFAENFLTSLLNSYRDYNLNLKKQSSDLSLNFIKNQVTIYRTSMKTAANELELFKKQHQLPDINTLTTQISSRTTELKKQQHEVEIQQEFVKLLEKSIANNFNQVDFLSMGLDQSTDQVLLKRLEQYNELIERRNELLLKNTANSPTIVNLERVLASHRSQILDNISFQKNKNKELQNKLTLDLATFRNQAQKIPALEKNFIYLQSNFEANRNIYSFLLNKEIETSIFNAGILPSFTTISPPDKEKVFPDPKAIAPLAILTGLVLGFGSILFARTTTSTFCSMEQIDAHPTINLLGVLPHFNGNLTHTPRDIATLYQDRSIFTESLKAIRVRLNLLDNSAPSTTKGGKQLLVTSDKAGEGKSLVALGLAISLTKIGKSVVLIGADLRKSYLHQLLKKQPTIGLSEYLESPTQDFSSLIADSGYPNLDIIPSEKKPVNPAELLQNTTMKQLLDQLRLNYDYIILDTAPIGLVSDSISALTQSDHILFVIRWLYSEKEVSQLPKQLVRDFQLPAIHVVVNDYIPDDLYLSVTPSSGHEIHYRHYHNANDYFAPPEAPWFHKLKKTLRI